MLKDVFSNRLFIGALAFFVLIVVSGTLYLRHIERQGQIELERTQERIKQWEASQKQLEKVPEGDTSQGGHFHADGTWHDQPHAPPVRSTTAQLREPVPVDTSRAPMNTSKGAGNPHPFQNVPVDLYDFEATKAAMIENINFVKANWDPKVYNREVSIADSLTANISNAADMPIFTREQRKELKALRMELLAFQGIEIGRIKALQEQGYRPDEAAKIATDETLRRWGG